VGGKDSGGLSSALSGAGSRKRGGLTYLEKGYRKMVGKEAVAGWGGGNRFLRTDTVGEKAGQYHSIWRIADWPLKEKT